MQLKDGQYRAGGINVNKIIEKYDMPLFVYDSDIIINQYKKLTSAFSVKDLRINFACKALTNITVLKLFKQLGAGLDTVSIQEIEL